MNYFQKKNLKNKSFYILIGARGCGKTYDTYERWKKELKGGDVMYPRKFPTNKQTKNEKLALKKYLVHNRDRLLQEQLELEESNLPEEEKNRKRGNILNQLRILNDIVEICDERNKY